jgi:hypothetical protein
MRKNLCFLFQLMLAILICCLVSNAQMVDNNRKEKISVAAVTEKSDKNNSKINTSSKKVDFSGGGSDEIFPSNNGWQFFGPVKELRANDGQEIVGNASAVFGTTSGTTRIAISICYTNDEHKMPVSFSGLNHLIVDADSLRRTFSVNITATLSAGVYQVGYCVDNRGPQTLNNNDYVNGWIMIVN